MDLPFFTGYGVEIGLLIDVLAARGLFSIAQVDLGTKRHRQRDLVALGEAAQQILSVVAVRQGLSAGPLSMVQFHLDEGLIVPTDVVVETQERPPMVTILERGA